jgi:hypothetical protein
MRNGKMTREPCGLPAGFPNMKDVTEFKIAPELYMRDGRIITSVADAIMLLREHETRPGVDARDEVLHRLERARTETELQQAADAFLAWAEELDLLLAPPEAAQPGHTPLQ